MADRAPHFVVKFKLRGRANRDRADRTIERGDAVLGSRPLADVYVQDRLVREEALVFRFDGTSLALEVKSRLAGVFVDGRPVTGRGAVRSGAAVQVGHCLVECVVDPDKSECTLTVNEQYLAQVVDSVVAKAKPAQAFALVDAGPQEHRWGKSAVLARANWIAAALGVVVLASFPFLRGSEAMSRGELFHAHAIGAKDGPKDCTACHAPFASDYTKKCSACHEGFDGVATHPFEANAGLSCSVCHSDHLGAAANLVPSLAAAGGGWPATCVRCHGKQPFPATDDAALALVPRAKTRMRDERGAPVARQLLVDGFSHKDHRVAKPGGIAALPGGPPEPGKAPVACDACHKPLAAGSAHPSLATAEFAPVRYEQCLECHADWRVDVHGRDSGGAACYACHAAAATPEAITKDLKVAVLPATGSKWVLTPRGHDFKSDECLACHVLERTAGGGRTSIAEKVFRHDHHLRSVKPSPGTELAASNECRTCHADVAGSETLAGTKLVDTTSCGTCHTGAVPTAVPVEEGATRRVTDMFHRVHTLDASALSKSALRYGSRESLGKGCLSCHTPGVGTAPMGLLPKADDCTACHGGHENLGDGKCVLCHVDRAPGANRVLDGRIEYRRNEPGIFSAAKATTKTTAAQARFDHGSAGHAKHACAECHAESGVDAAERVLDVPWPAHDEASCVKCHVRERFHR